MIRLLLSNLTPQNSETQRPQLRFRIRFLPPSAVLLLSSSHLVSSSEALDYSEKGSSSPLARSIALPTLGGPAAPTHATPPLIGVGSAPVGPRLRLPPPEVTVATGPP